MLEEDLRREGEGEGEGRGGEGGRRTAGALRRVPTQSLAIPPSHTHHHSSTHPHHPPTYPTPHHHLHTLLHPPMYTTTFPHTPTLPSRTSHLQEASLPLVGRQPLQVMGEQGSLQVADGRVADIATWVTAHASHSLGSAGNKERGGRGERARININTTNTNHYHTPCISYMYFTSVDTQMNMNTHNSPPSSSPQWY